jgi:hypothetical protein
MKEHIHAGVEHALSRFKIADVAPAGILDKLKTFGAGQVGAAKDLFHNLRGGLGGQMNPALITGPVPPQSMDLARATHRQQALGNLGKLAPSLAAGGLYMWHRRNQEQDEQARRRAMMAQQGYPPQGYSASPGYPAPM